jgi:hypothetical protein
LSGLGLDFCDATFKLCIATLIVAARNGLGRFVGVSSLNLGRAFGRGPFFFAVRNASRRYTRERNLVSSKTK